MLLAVLGVGALIFANAGEDPSHITFSLIAFVISVAALFLTTIQSVSIARQMQMTERAAREVRETSEQIKRPISSDERLVHDIREDIELDHKIIAALEEHDVGDSAQQCHDVAKRIASKLKVSTIKR